MARENSAHVVNACLRQALEPSTRHSYSSALRKVVGDAEWLIGANLLPLDSDLKLMALIAELDGRLWGTVASFKATVQAWHV